ncbi:hypothetical protein ACIRBY_04715 [Streptomyces sp. NPDC096136]|uniref:hypothetical protein n=1 Tax=Streptomyces sp. NPDC096136 TaxID=3366076 RepID=UPI0037FBBC98
MATSSLVMAAGAAVATAASAPACAVFLTATRGADTRALVLAVGSVDLGAAALLLLGALPAVVLLRRRPPRIPDRLHAGGCTDLLCLVPAAMPVRTP